MATSGFFDTNRRRAYPFITGTTHQPGPGMTAARLPNSTIVDAGFMVGPGSFHNADTITRLSVKRINPFIYFYVHSTAYGLIGHKLTFEVPQNAKRYTTFFADILRSDSRSSGECLDVAWEGYLTIGDLDELLNIIDDGEELTLAHQAAVFEPALFQNLDKSRVTGISIVNLDRPRVTSPAGCDPIIWPVQPEPLYVWQRCLSGDIRVKAGYNVQVIQDNLQNSIILSPVVGAGLGEPCHDVPVFPGETPPDGSPFKGGGPGCGEVLRSINGKGGRYFDITTGVGIRLEPQPAQNKLIVHLDFTGVGFCDSESN